MAGKVYEHNTASGKNYKIYIPDNYNPNTPILSYNFSVGMKDNNENYVWNEAVATVEKQGYDNVFLFPNYYDPRTWDKQYQNNSLEILEDAKKRYGLTSDQFMTIGFSSCCSQSVKTTAQYIAKNPGVGRQIAFTQDGFIWKNGVLTGGELNSLIKNDTLIVAYCQPENKMQLSKPVLQNLDMLIITDKDQYINHYTGYWGRHDEIALDFFYDGLYNEVLNFINGDGTLDTSRYNFYTTDSAGNLVAVTDPKEFYELLGIDTYERRNKKLLNLPDYALTSDGGIVAGYMNDIRHNIRSSSFLTASGSFTGFSGASDTAVPSQIPGCVAKYFDNVSKNLCTIADFTTDISKVHTSYQNTDKTLSDMVDR